MPCQRVFLPCLWIKFRSSMQEFYDFWHHFLPILGLSEWSLSAGAVIEISHYLILFWSLYSRFHSDLLPPEVWNFCSSMQLGCSTPLPLNPWVWSHQHRLATHCYQNRKCIHLPHCIQGLFPSNPLPDTNTIPNRPVFDHWYSLVSATHTPYYYLIFLDIPLLVSLWTVPALLVLVGKPIQN